MPHEGAACDFHLAFPTSTRHALHSSLPRRRGKGDGGGLSSFYLEASRSRDSASPEPRLVVHDMALFVRLGGPATSMRALSTVHLARTHSSGEPQVLCGRRTRSRRDCIHIRAVVASPCFTRSTSSVIMSDSQLRQNYHSECEGALNKQINIELHASYVYLSMAYHFDRDDVALPNIAKWLRKQSDEEREHAQKFMKYQNMRGGRIVLRDVQKPETDNWGSPLQAFQAALAVEKANNQSLMELHATATEHSDMQFCDFIENEFLAEQVKSIEEIGRIVTNLKRAGPGLGELQVDRELFD